MNKTPSGVAPPRGCSGSLVELAHLVPLGKVPGRNLPAGDRFLHSSSRRTLPGRSGRRLSVHSGLSGRLDNSNPRFRQRPSSAVVCRTNSNHRVASATAVWGPLVPSFSSSLLDRTPLYPRMVHTARKHSRCDCATGNRATGLISCRQFCEEFGPAEVNARRCSGLSIADGSVR